MHQFAGLNNLWAPIMGVGYYVPVTQWSRGEYPNANNFEDDVAKITTFIPRIADDYSNTRTGAAFLTSGVTRHGLITTAADVDFFQFAAAANAPINLTAQVVALWSKDVWPDFHNSNVSLKPRHRHKAQERLRYTACDR
jgi:hypothetical protein